MDARIFDLPFDPAQIDGLSEKLLRSHHQNNYSGAVKRLNAIRAQLLETSFATAPGFQLNGLKREELVATNSMLLHELYFDVLGGRNAAMPPQMAQALATSFSTPERWRDEFVAMGKALGGGSGWVLLSFQPREGTLVNQWAADHTHAVAGGIPILALDMYEHAYHLDFGAAAAAYVDAFMANIRWPRVYQRYQDAVNQASESLGTDGETTGQSLFVDVRRAAVFEQADRLIAGARWFDPDRLEACATAMPKDVEVIVYCVHGHEVSRTAALRLRALGLRAKFLLGGINAWQAAHRPVEAKA